MQIKNIFKSTLILLVFLLPYFASAQAGRLATYGHTGIAETSVTISGTVVNQQTLNLGFSIVFGTVPGFLINVVPIIPDIDGNYSIRINNLLGSTTYYYKVVFGPIAVSMGQEKSFKTAASSLIINHKEVNQAGAKIYGNVSSGHPDFIVKYGRTTSVNEGSFSVSPDSYGAFDEYFPVSLPPNTTIYYRAVNSLLPLIYYSPLKSFKTLAESVTFDFRNLTSSSVSVFGTTTVGTPAPKVFLSKDGQIGGELEFATEFDANNNWTANFNGLDPETLYYVRAAKKTDSYYTYLIKWFTTATSNLSLQFFNITDSSVTVSGNLPFGTDAILLCFATSPETLASAPDCGSGPVYAFSDEFLEFEKTFTNLASNTTYYFVARNASNTLSISEVFTVDTFAPPAPNQTGGSINLEQGPKSLVPCVGFIKGSKQAYDCDFNALMQLANNIIDFLLKTIALPLFALIFAYAGWLFMSSAENPNQRAKAKDMIKSSVFGFVLALAAFIIIKTILMSLGYEGISFLDF